MIFSTNPKTDYTFFPQQPNKTEHFASILIVTYNHKDYLDACISSIRSQNYPHEIIIIDNCSTDGTVEFLRDSFPDVTVIKSHSNKGYGAGNNLGASLANGDVLVILNPDTVVERGWLEELVSPIYSGGRLITTPKILTYDGSHINTCGNINHFTGLTFTRGYNASPSDYSTVENVSGVSGACFAIKKTFFLELGGFDEKFFLYNEDSDLSWRALLENFQIKMIPSSLVRHNYSLNVPPEKVYYLEKGRYLILRKYYSMEDFVSFLPSLILVEIITLVYALKLGKNGLKCKFKSILALKINHPQILHGNRTYLFSSLNTAIPTDQLIDRPIERKLLTFSNRIFAYNHRFLK